MTDTETPCEHQWCSTTTDVTETCAGCHATRPRDVTNVLYAPFDDLDWTELL